MQESYIMKFRNFIYKNPILLVLVFVIRVSLAWIFFEFSSMFFVISVSILTVFSSILMYSRDNNGVTITFMVSLLTIFMIDWDSHPAYKVIFFILYTAYVVIIGFLSSIKIRIEQEAILKQASEYTSASKNDLKKMVDDSKEMNLTVIEKSEVVRFLAMHHLTLDEMKAALPEVNRIKVEFQLSSEKASKTYYTLYQLMDLKKVEDINEEIEKTLDKMFDLPLESDEVIELIAQIKSKIISSKDSPEVLFEKIRAMLAKGIDLTEIKKEM